MVILKTSELTNDDITRNSVDKFLKTGELPDSGKKRKIDNDVDANGNGNGADEKPKVAITSSSKRDCEGNVKPNPGLDQICSVVAKTQIYTNFSNFVLVKLSLDEDCHSVKIGFSKKFNRLLNEKNLKVSCLHRSQVIKKKSGYYTFIQIYIEHADDLVILELEKDFHLANFQKLGGSHSQSEILVTVASCQRVKISPEPKIYNVLLKTKSKPPEDALFYLTDTFHHDLDIESCCFKQSKRHNSSQMFMKEQDQISAQILIKSKNNRTFFLFPGQPLAKASNCPKKLDFGQVMCNEKPPEVTSCDDVDILREADIESLTLHDRKKLAEEKRKEANVLFDREMYQEAVKKYTMAIKYDENQASFYGKRSDAFLAMDDHQNALEDALKSVEIDPSYVNGWVKASKCHINLGNIEEAKQICDKIVKLSPNLTSLIADELEKIKTIQGLEAEFTKLNTGGNHRLSLMILDKISKLCPNSQKNNILRAQLHVYQGQG